MFHFETPCDIIILAGQSNAEGSGIGECEKPYGKDERVLFLDTTKIPTFEPVKDSPDLLYLEMKDRTESQIGVAELKTRGCFAHYFAREYVKNGFLKEGRKLLIVYSPVGATSFGDKYWGEGKSEHFSGYWTTDGPLYKRMIGLIDDALKLNPENKIVGLLWHQGESDAKLNPDDGEKAGDELEKRYYAWLSELERSIRERYGLEWLPVVCGEFVKDSWYRTNRQASERIFAATRKLMKEINGGFVETDGLLSNDQKVHNGDCIHFCHDSLRVLGERYFEEYAKIVK